MRWPLVIFRVEGHSMLPSWPPGTTLLGWRGWLTVPAISWLYPGRVVVARVGNDLVVKRIASRANAGQLQLIGDNPTDSRDSRHFGAVDSRAVMAVILCRIP